MAEELLMKKTRYSEPQILAILRQAEGGVPVSELCRERGMSNAPFYKWRAALMASVKPLGPSTTAIENVLDAQVVQD
jgi:transposase-like protein